MASAPITKPSTPHWVVMIEPERKPRWQNYATSGGALPRYRRRTLVFPGQQVELDAIEPSCPRGSERLGSGGPTRRWGTGVSRREFRRMSRWSGLT
jgi:hypothetical protein